MRNRHPNPELRRAEWRNLCGEWEFGFDFGNSLYTGYREVNMTNFKWTFLHLEKNFTQKINVPFSPESKLSGLEYKDFINACWYRKIIDVSDRRGKRVILHFEAAFHTSHLFVNGKFVGSHRGGYTPFEFDISDFLTDDKNEIILHCSGDSRNCTQPSGKQSPDYQPNGCYYDRNSGIWGPVWMEYVPETYIKNVKYTADFANNLVRITLSVCGISKGEIAIRSFYKNEPTGNCNYRYDGQGEVVCELKLSDMHLWEVEKGGIYDAEIVLKTDNGKDEISSYFGLRKLQLDEKGLKINGKRIFQRLVLDQGYYPDGLYTAPDDSCFKNDIKLSKAMGFNGARLHQKVFDRTFLYEADIAGYICWGEYPSWGFDVSRDDALAYFLPEWVEAVERDYNHPCIIGWCPMNENNDVCGRHQNETFVRQIYLTTKKLDKTRPVIDASGWFHVNCDIYDIHDYSQGEEFVNRFSEFEEDDVYDSNELQKEYAYKGQPYFLSEYGGLKYPDDNSGWGYNKEKINSEEDFISRLLLIQKTIYNNPKISAACYTQLYDVQHERNGLYYYDRKPKFSIDNIKRINGIISAKSKYEEL